MGVSVPALFLRQDRPTRKCTRGLDSVTTQCAFQHFEFASCLYPQRPDGSRVAQSVADTLAVVPSGAQGKSTHD